MATIGPYISVPGSAAREYIDRTTGEVVSQRTALNYREQQRGFASFSERTQRRLQAEGFKSQREKAALTKSALDPKSFLGRRLEAYRRKQRREGNPANDKDFLSAYAKAKKDKKKPKGGQYSGWVNMYAEEDDDRDLTYLEAF